MKSGGLDQSPCSRSRRRTRGEGTQSSGILPKEASGEAKLECVSLACRHAVGVKKVTVRTLRAEPCSAGHEGTWAPRLAKTPPEHHAAASATGGGRSANERGD